MADGRAMRPSEASDDESAGVDFDILPALVGYQVKRTNDRLYRAFAEHLATLGLTPGQFGLLILIGANPGLTQTGLARVIGTTRSFMVRLIDRLQAAGLVERRPVPRDRRSYAIAITAAGERMLARLKDDVRRHEQARLVALDENEVATLLALLRKLNDDD